MKCKDLFLTGVSHELRNPLNSLKGSIDIICDTNDEKEQKEYLGKAKLCIEILV